MLELVLAAIVSATIGACIAWVIAGLRIRNKQLSERREIEGRAVVAETTVSALRQQLEEASSALVRAREELDGERHSRTTAEVRLSESERRLDEQHKLIEDAERRFADTFRALSDDALKSNNQAFLQLAKQTLDRAITESKGDLGQRQEAIKGLVKPLEDTLKRYEEGLKDLEKNRAEAYGTLREQIQNLVRSEEQLQHQAENLVSALRLPQVRGRWGEMTLRRVVELAGMSEHCDFVEQLTVESEEGRLRPDLVVQLPLGRQIIVDAKTPLDAYLNAIESPENQIEVALREHATQLRAHMTKLSSKAYWSQFSHSPELVVMFIPGESFLSPGLRFDRTLMEDGMASRVILATPTTLISLLHAIAYGWRQEQLTKNAQAIAEIGRQVHGRFKTFLDHVSGLRKDLEQSIYSFNRMLGSLEGRILPGVRKFRELGATGEDSLQQITPIEQLPRQLTSSEETVDDATDLKEKTGSGIHSEEV